MRRVLLVLLMASALAPAAAAAPVSITGAWFRALPGTLPAAGYLTLTNTGSRGLALLGAQSPACGSLELHMTHAMEGMVHMMAVANVDLPPGTAVRFAPGGLHLMCNAPKLQPGTNVPVTLRFSDGSQTTAAFAVRNAAGK